MKYHLTNTNSYIHLTGISDKKKISKAIKNHMARNKIDPSLLFGSIQTQRYKCSWCGQFNNAFYYVCSIDQIQKTVSVIDLDYNFLDKLKAKYVCYRVGCDHKKLNPNSVEFISKAYGLSELDAKEYLHSRNKTPFYKTNHRSTESYSRSQKTFSLTNKKLSTKKANFARSLDGHIKKHGMELGPVRWLETQKRKAITIENFIQSGCTYNEAIFRYNQWYQKTRFSKEAYIEKYGPIIGSMKYLERLGQRAGIYSDIISSKDESIKWIADQIEHDSLSICIDYPIEEKLTSKTIFNELMDKFSLTVTDIISELKSRPYGFQTLRWYKPGQYGLMSWTTDGQLLRSSYEYKFYQMFKLSKIGNLPIKIDNFYPCKKFKYDFYFPDLDMYIEIAGMLECPWYSKRIQQKVEKYNCIVASTPTDYADILSILCNLANKKGLIT